jgi:outer membrane protein assembly factor BamB
MFRGNPARTGITPGPGPQREPVALWCVRTGLDAIAAPAVADGTVYLGGSNGSIYAIEAATGQENWTLATRGPIAGSPAVVAGVVYVPSTDGLLYAVDAGSGQAIWTAPIKGFANSSPAVADGLVFVATLEGGLIAVRVDHGSPVWEVATGLTLVSSPAVAGGRVVIGGLDGTLIALDAATGAEVWRSSTRLGVANQTPAAAAINNTVALADGSAYIVASDGILRAWDTTTGEPRWNANVGATVGLAPAVAGGLVYAPGGDRLFVLDAASGATVWEIAGTTRSGSASSIVVTQDGAEVYVGTTAGELVAVDAASRKVRWRLSGFPLSPDVAPVVAGAVVYSGSAVGTLYALGESGAGENAPGCDEPVGAA